MPECFLRLPQVIARTGLSRSTIYEYITLGMFPAPIKAGKRASVWLESEVLLWMNRRISDSRDNNPP